ncbi:methyltransferase [Luteolibacter algae]|uniref:Methyltransferase n=2 Tax=Luteolibacter algae TaxID=454151 RepID=A0ABW5DB97_9BACT
MNPILTQHPTTDPAIILQLRDRQYAAELIATALLRFDFFSWLQENEGTTEEAAAKYFQCENRPFDVLLTLCRAYGFITGGADGLSLTGMGKEHLVEGSPWYLGPYYTPMRDTPIVRTYLHVLGTGKPGNWRAKDTGADWHDSMREPAFAKEFTGLMNCRGLLLGQKLAESITPFLGERTRLLDIGGGSGIYSATLCAAHPQLSATVFEQAPVDRIARSEVGRHGLEDRISVKTGDMFLDEWPEAEIILLSNVLHDWDIPQVREIIIRAAKSLVPDGLLIIHDAFIDDDKCGPVEIAEYSALLMNITQGKCYSVAEYAGILAPLGFEIGSFNPTISKRGFVTAIKK